MAIVCCRKKFNSIKGEYNYEKVKENCIGVDYSREFIWL